MTTLSASTNQPSLACRQPDCESSLTPLEPDRLADHIDALYRAACALCGSRHDAEDLVQETFALVLKRPRFVRRGHELGYLLRRCATPTTVAIARQHGTPQPWDYPKKSVA